MTAKRLFCIGLPSLLIVIAGLIVRAQDAPKTNDAAIEELKQEKQAAAAVAPAAEPKIEELLPAAEAKKPAPEAPKTEAAPAVAPVIEELVPAKAEEQKPVAAEAPKAQAAPVVTPIEDLLPAKVEAAKPATNEAPVATAPVVAPAAQMPAAEAQPAAVPGATPAVSGRSTEAEAIANVEVVRRQADAKEGQMAIQDADKAWKDGDYAAALKGYLRAAAKLHGTSMERSRAVERIPACEYRVALGLMKAGRNTEALAKANDALNRFPNDKDLKKLKGKLEASLAAGGTSTPTPVTGEPLSEVEKQMMEGKRFLAARDYARARESFESVLALDRDNREAMRYLKEIGELQYNTASVERQATAAKMSAQVRDTWNPPQYRALAASKPTTNTTNTAPDNNILKKMERIIIPEIEFRQANIHDVVDFLNKASVEADKSEPDPSKKGINIILNLNPAGGATATAAAPARAGGDLFGGDQAAAAGGGGPQVAEITFTARYISMLSAMKIITSVAGLRYRVDGNIVMIVPADYDPAQIEVRMYPVEPTFIQRVTEARAAMPAAPNKTVGGREVVGIEQPEAGGTVGDLKTIFDGMGVKFPKGASITYNSAIGKVIVANTAENLAIFEKLLAELNVVPKQVEIEARFVEVNETDLKELGLEWLLNNSMTLATKNVGAMTPLSATPSIQLNQNATSGGFTSGLQFLGTDSSTGNTSPEGGGKGTLGSILSVSSILTSPDLTTVLHALEQNGNADLLSAPKVTTRSGSEASIRVVTEYIYPTTFQVQGGQMQGAQAGVAANVIQQTVVVPQDFQTREVGVILTVLPEVSPDGNMINLTMTPSVVTDPTWFQYGSTIKNADGSTEQLNMPQPFFHTRTLNTQISIYDGATVVMGGLITESLNKVNDKIPILGDIPLLGMLFRSQSEDSVKKNLLIFVTARLVDPAGKAIRNPESEKATMTPMAPAAPVAQN